MSEQYIKFSFSLFLICTHTHYTVALFTDHWFKLLSVVLIQSIILKIANSIMFTRRTEFMDSFLS